MLIQEEFDEWFETHIEKNKCKINTQMLPGWGDEQAVFQCSVEKLNLGVLRCLETVTSKLFNT